MRVGERDRHALVKAFARHRLAATPPSSAPALEGLREAAQALIDEGPTLFHTTTWDKLAKALASPNTETAGERE
jgi:hypothetical protein